jgi:hypothetical protein
MKKLQFIPLVLLVLPVLLVFQNCSQIQFSANNGGLELKSENNGGGYSGKPSGDFYQFTPGFTCENREAYLASIQMDSAVVTRTVNKKMACSATKQTLDESKLDISVYQNEVVGFQDGIYEGKNSQPSSIPSNLVEVWCRDAKDTRGIETITHFDRASNLAVNRIYYTTLNSSGASQSQLTPDFTVARVVSQKTVIVNDGKDFELIVHRDQPAPQLGLFVGHLKALVGGKYESRETFCRFGGSLDASVWPVKQIVDMNVVFFKTSPDRNYFSYSSDTAAALASRANLFTSKFDGSNQVKVGWPLSLANWNFKFSFDSKKLLFMEDGQGTLLQANLETVNVDGSGKAELSKVVTTATGYSFTGDGNYVVYDGGQAVGSWLISQELNGGGSFKFNGLMPAQTGDPTVKTVQNLTSYRFFTSNVGNRIAFLCCHPNIELYTAFADGTGLAKITPPMPAGYVVYGAVFATSASDRLLNVYAWTDPGLTGNVHYLNFALNVDGSGLLPIPEGWIWSQTSPSGIYGIFANQLNATERKLINFKTNSTILLPAFAAAGPAVWSESETPAADSYFFTADSTAYIGHVFDSVSGRNKVLAVSTLDGTVSELCPGVSSTNIREILPNTFAIIAKDPSVPLFKVYTTSLGGVCQLVNSVPLPAGASTTFNIRSSRDGGKVLVLAQVLMAGEAQAQHFLYHVPLDGKPSMLISAPVSVKATIHSFEFGAAGNTVTYSGDQIHPGEINVFHWKAP